MRWRTRLGAVASPPSVPAIAVVKKYFSSKMPRGVAMYLFAVTRLTVLSCISTAVGDVAQDQRAQMRDAVAQEPVLLADDLGRDLQDGLAALLRAISPASWRSPDARQRRRGRPWRRAARCGRRTGR